MSASTFDLIGARLRNQKLVGSTLRSPLEVVAWLGAVQAQDYTGAKWAIGQRVKGLTDADVDRAFNDGAILRTHVMRPTWHFVAPADIRWMLALTAPRVKAVMASYDRKLELDAPLYARSHAVLTRALQGGKHLTRTELAAALARAKISASGQRLGHLMLRAELDAVICSGPRRGKQFTYALLDEWAPPAKALTRDEALAELTRRYFSSHGPATVRDFVWWSGLTVREAKAGIEMLGSAPSEVEGLSQATMNGLTNWWVPSKVVMRRPPTPFVCLLSNYDEYGIAYKDRGAMVDPRLPPQPAGAMEFSHLLLVDGRWVGSWKRTITMRAAAIEVRPCRKLTRDEQRSVTAEAARYGRFLNLPTTLSYSPSRVGRAPL
jgi:hypothetical protein